MKRFLSACLILFLAQGTLFSQLVSAQTHKLLFTTNHGDFKVVLYDFTPQHRDMILQAVRNGEYTDALFNRVIENFVVQGGEHDIDIAKREADDPDGPRPRLAPEFDDRAFHKIGALGAGRDDNPQKASFLNQLYFVVGRKPVSEADLTTLEARKSIRFTTGQRKEYLQNGGLPRLDKDYVIFGEVYEGIDVLMRISRVSKDKQDFPLQKVVFSVQKIQE